MNKIYFKLAAHYFFEKITIKIKLFYSFWKTICNNKTSIENVEIKN
jgi:hypothetical protein